MLPAVNRPQGRPLALLAHGLAAFAAKCRGGYFRVIGAVHIYFLFSSFCFNGPGCFNGRGCSTGCFSCRLFALASAAASSSWRCCSVQSLIWFLTSSPRR